jgi:cyclopropane fatty-acyl-phospholipid synthase-like methyltransferase
MTNQAPARHQQITAYYDQTELDYALVLGLGRNLALHFGYWDDTTRSLAQALARENEILARLARPDSGSLVLDAGCGVGGSAIYLARHFGCRVIGISLSGRQIARARANAARRGVAGLTEFLVRDFSRSDLAERSFDLVWAIESVCHADDKSAFVREAYRLLKPGGRLVVADGFAAKNDFVNEESRVMRSWLHNWGVGALATADEFAGYLHANGFGAIAHTDVSANVMPTSRRLYRWSFPALFVGKILQWLGLRNAIQTGNIVAARYQHLALRAGLWRYGIFYAEK